MIQLPSTKNIAINPNFIVIYDVMFIMASSIWKNLGALFQTLVKAFGLQKAEVTVLILIVAIKIFP